MSGGSLDYVYSQVQDAATTIRHRATQPEHRAFATHLEKVAKALHDIEWVMSSDYGDGDEVESIMAVISTEDLLNEALKEAVRVQKELEELVRRIQPQSPDTKSEGEV